MYLPNFYEYINIKKQVYTDQDLIPCIRLPGGHRRFRYEDVEAFLARLQNSRISDPTEEQMAALLREYGE